MSPPSVRMNEFSQPMITMTEPPMVTARKYPHRQAHVSTMGLEIEMIDLAR